MKAADQRYYVSSTRRFHEATGVRRLHQWLSSERAERPAARAAEGGR